MLTKRGQTLAALLAVIAFTAILAIAGAIETAGL